MLRWLQLVAITMAAGAATPAPDAYAANHNFTIKVHQLGAPDHSHPALFHRFKLIVEVTADPGCRGTIALRGDVTSTFPGGETKGHIFHITYPASSEPVPKAGFVDEFGLAPGDKVVVTNLEATCGDTMPGDNRGTAPGPFGYSAPPRGPDGPRPTQSRFSSDEKAKLKHAARQNQRMSGMWGIGGAGCALGGIFTGGAAWGACAVIGGLGSGLTGYYAQDFDELADDPPDPDFRTFAPTVRRPVPAIPLGMAGSIRQPLERLLEHYVTMQAESHALLLSLYKADGAQQAGDALWEGQQNSAAGGHARLLAELVAVAAARREELARALEVNGVAVSWSADAVLRAQNEMLAADKPLPPPFIEILRSGALSEQEITYLRDGFLMADPESVAGNLPGLLRIPSLAASEQEVAEVFRRFAGDADCLLPGGTPDLDGDGRRDACDSVDNRCKGQSCGKRRDVRAPRLALFVPRQRASKVLRRGLIVRARSDERCRLNLRLDVKQGKRIRLAGRASSSLVPRTRKGVRIKLSRKAARTLRRSPRSTQLMLAASAVDRSANRSPTKRRRVRLVR